MEGIHRGFAGGNMSTKVSSGRPPAETDESQKPGERPRAGKPPDERRLLAKPKCTEAQKAFERTRCSRVYVRENLELSRLRNLRWDLLERQESNNRRVGSLRKEAPHYADASKAFEKQLTDYLGDLATTTGFSWRLSAKERALGSEYNALEAWCARLQQQIDNANNEADSIEGEEQHWRDRQEALAQRLARFLASLVCTKCKQVAELLDDVSALSLDLDPDKVDPSANPAPPSLVPPAPKPPLPPWPPGPGPSPGGHSTPLGSFFPTSAGGTTSVPTVARVRWLVESAIIPCDFAHSTTYWTAIDGVFCWRAAINLVISAQVLDPAGNPIPNLPVRFSSSPDGYGNAVVSYAAWWWNSLPGAQLTDHEGKVRCHLGTPLYAYDEYSSLNDRLIPLYDAAGYSSMPVSQRQVPIYLQILTGWELVQASNSQAVTYAHAATTMTASAHHRHIFVEPGQPLFESGLSAQAGQFGGLGFDWVGPAPIIGDYRLATAFFVSSEAELLDLFGILKWTLDRFLDGVRDRLFPDKVYDAMLNELGVTDSQFRAGLYGYVFGVPKGVLNNVNGIIQAFELFLHDAPKALFEFIKKEATDDPAVFIAGVCDFFSSPGAAVAKYVTRKGAEAYAFLDANKDTIKQVIANLQTQAAGSSMSVASAVEKVCGFVYGSFEEELKPFTSFLEYRPGTMEYESFIAAFIVGDIIGYVAFEIGLQLALGLLTEGAGNAILAMAEMGGIIGRGAQALIALGQAVIRVAEAVGQIVELLTQFVRWIATKVLDTIAHLAGTGAEAVARVFTIMTRFLAEAGERALASFYKVMERAMALGNIGELLTNFFKMAAYFLKGTANRVLEIWTAVLAKLEQKLLAFPDIARRLIDTIYKTFQFLVSIAERSKGAVADAISFVGPYFRKAVECCADVIRLTSEAVLMELTDDVEDGESANDVEEFLQGIALEADALDAATIAALMEVEDNAPDYDTIMTDSYLGLKELLDEYKAGY